MTGSNARAGGCGRPRQVAEQQTLCRTPLVIRVAIAFARTLTDRCAICTNTGPRNDRSYHACCTAQAFELHLRAAYRVGNLFGAFLDGLAYTHFFNDARAYRCLWRSATAWLIARRASDSNNPATVIFTFSSNENHEI
jgi:hypothetical protein